MDGMLLWQKTAGHKPHEDGLCFDMLAGRLCVFVQPPGKQRGY